MVCEYVCAFVEWKLKISFVGPFCVRAQSLNAKRVFLITENTPNTFIIRRNDINLFLMLGWFACTFRIAHICHSLVVDVFSSSSPFLFSFFAFIRSFSLCISTCFDTQCSFDGRSFFYFFFAFRFFAFSTASTFMTFSLWLNEINQ